MNISVRKTGVTAALNGKTFVNWPGNTSRLSVGAAQWKVVNWKGLYLGTCESRYQVTKLALTPISGQGKRLR